MSELPIGKRHAWMAFTSMMLISFILNGLCWNCFTLYADPVISDWGITRSAFMVVITILSSCNTLISLFFYGGLVSRFGLRRMILVGGSLMTAGYAVFALSQNLVMLYIGAMLFGFGLSMMSDNTYNVACTQWFKKNRSTMISIIGTIGTVAGSAFAPLVTFWIAATGWHGSFWITTALVAVMTILGVLMYKGAPEDLHERPLFDDVVAAVEQKGEEGVSYRDMLRHPAAWALVVAWLLIGIAGFAVRGNLALFAVDYGYGDYQGFALSVLLIASAVFMPIGGVLCDRFASRSMVVIGMLSVVAACVILLMPSIPLWLLYVAAALLGFGWDVNIVPVAPCILETFGSRDFPKKTGLFVGMQALGVAVAPTFLSLFYDLGGGTYDLGLKVTMVFAIAVIIVYSVVTRRTKF